MNCLKRKLESERGASILLALLFLLVCMMVGASVLAAAASNAGKIRSNQTEQQRYLTLSSAIQLVADEIATAKYTGKYKVWEWTETVTEKDEDGNPVVKETIDYFYYQQEAGEYDCGNLTAQLPLGPKLDELFGNQQFKVPGDTADKDGYKSLDIPSTANGTHTLTVTLSEAPAGYPSGPGGEYTADLAVTVEVKLDLNTKHIRLTAWEGEIDPAAPPDMSKTLQAELVAKITTNSTATPPERAEGNLTLGDVPSGRRPLPSDKTAPTAVGDPPVTDPSPGETAEVTAVPKPGKEGTVIGSPMVWELNWIKKGAAW